MSDEEDVELEDEEGEDEDLLSEEISADLYASAIADAESPLVVQA